jgi:hypothetical protein
MSFSQVEVVKAFSFKIDENNRNSMHCNTNLFLRSPGHVNTPKIQNNFLSMLATNFPTFLAAGRRKIQWPVERLPPYKNAQIPRFILQQMKTLSDAGLAGAGKSYKEGRFSFGMMAGQSEGLGASLDIRIIKDELIQKKYRLE